MIKIDAGTIALAGHNVDSLIEEIRDAVSYTEADDFRQVMIRLSNGVRVQMVKKEMEILKELVHHIKQLEQKTPIYSATAWTCFCEDQKNKEESVKQRFNSGAPFYVVNIELSAEYVLNRKLLNIGLGLDIKGENTGLGRVSVAQIEKAIVPSLAKLREQREEVEEIKIGKKRTESISSRYENAGMWG